ncbi:MAG TPA: hypothetical protein DCK99_13945, partial [Blastocatellia bacterium]|nr:hypothetical protein [Blastocatellia bacterium]
RCKSSLSLHQKLAFPLIGKEFREINPVKLVWLVWSGCAVNLAIGSPRAYSGICTTDPFAVLLTQRYRILVLLFSWKAPT